MSFFRRFKYTRLLADEIEFKAPSWQDIKLYWKTALTPTYRRRRHGLSETELEVHFNELYFKQVQQYRL